jgi:hypothetical protein
MGIATIRTAPFGNPPAGNAGHENEVLNPGRFQYGAKSTMGYYSGTISGIADPWQFVWWDGLYAVTEDDGTVPPVPNSGDTGSDDPAWGEEPEPDPDAPWFINRKNTWQSGPSDNDLAFDNALPKAGYWTKAGGPHSNDSKKDGGFQMITGSDRPVLLYNMGHENTASQSGSAETNVIGWDGYLSADAQGISSSKTMCSIGAPHAYAMYTLDMDLYTIKKLANELKDWIEGQGDSSYTPSEDKDVSHVNAILTEMSETNTRSLTIEAIRRIYKMLVRLIEQMNSQGVVGGKIVNWDFLAELKVPTSANEYLRPPDHTVQHPTGDEYERYNWGKGGPHGPRRFSYTIDMNIAPILFLLKMRANGILWHLSSPAGGNRTRILRTTNFAHIHGLSSTHSIDSAKNKKYAQILSYWSSDLNPHAINDPNRRIDTRS